MTKSNFWIITDISYNNPSTKGGVYHRITWFNWDTGKYDVTDVVETYRNYRSHGWPQILAGGIGSVYDRLTTHRERTTKTGQAVVDADGNSRKLAQLSISDSVKLVDYRNLNRTQHPMDRLFEAAL